MPRSTVAQRVQIGKETVAGTVVPANKSLGSLGLGISPTVENTIFRPKGNKYPTIVTPNKEWATVSLEGQPTYQEVVYPLAGILGTPVITPVAGSTGAHSWVFSPKSEGADVPQTYTVEVGDGTTTERVAHTLFRDWGMELSRSELSMDGEGFGMRMEKGVTQTASPTPVAAALEVIQPGQVCVYVSDTVAGLSTVGNRQGTLLAVNVAMSGRFDPVWYLNCTLASFGSYVETPEPDFTLEFTSEANAAGLAWIDQFRAGSTKFVRVEAKGAQIGAGPAVSRLTMDFAVKVAEPGALDDEDGIYAIAPTLQVVHDATWGKACSVEVVNNVSAL